MYIVYTPSTSVTHTHTKCVRIKTDKHNIFASIYYQKWDKVTETIDIFFFLALKIFKNSKDRQQTRKKIFSLQYTI